MDFKKFAFNNIIRNFRAYLGYFLSSSFSIMIFFAFAVSMFHPMILNNISSGSTAFMALMTTEVIIFGFSMLFIIYSLSNFIKSRSKEFGTLIIMGMSETQFRKLIILENLIIGGFSIILGLSFGMLLSKVFLTLLSNILYMNLNSLYLPIKAVIMTIVSFTLLFAITGPFTLRLINKKGMIDLLKGNQKPKEEIKSSKIKGLLGIGLILLFYFLLLFGDKLTKRISMYIIAIVFIAGIYLFYSQFTVLTLNNIKEKNNIYKKNTNMLLISNLVYKMKDNARLLILITILLSGTLVALSTTDSIVNTQGNMSKDNFSMVYSYFTKPNNQRKSEELDSIKRTIKDYDYEELSFEMIDNDFNIILNVKDYNKLAKKINLKEINLSNDEVFLVTRYNDKNNIKELEKIKEYEINNNKLKVSGVSEKNIFPTGMFTSIAVINDDLYSNIEGKFDKITFYGFDYDDWEETGEITNKLKEDNFNYGDDERMSYFLTLPDMYLAELQQAKILQFMGTSIGIIFFIAVLSFLYFRLFTDEESDRVKYNSLSKVGLSYNGMKKIVTIEVGSLFLIPFILSSINTLVAIIFVSNKLRIPVNINSFKVLSILSILYIAYFIIIKNKYIKNIWVENR